MLTALLLLQAATMPEAPGAPPGRIDLTTLPGAPRPCRDAAADGGDIVVCGHGKDRYRLKPLPDRYAAPSIPRALVKLPGGATAQADVTQTASPDGKPDKRIMVTLKVPL